MLLCPNSGQAYPHPDLRPSACVYGYRDPSLALWMFSQRNIPMLLRRIFVALGLQHFQRVDEPFARLAWLDDGVHVTPLGGDVRICKTLAELLHFLCPLSCCGLLQVALIDDVHRAF